MCFISQHGFSEVTWPCYDSPSSHSLLLCRNILQNSLCVSHGFVRRESDVCANYSFKRTVRCCGYLPTALVVCCFYTDFKLLILKKGKSMEFDRL